MNLHNFINNINEETFNKYKDKLMKSVSEDLHLIAFILWCLNILYEEKSLKEMVDFLGNVSTEELKTNIVKVNPKIDTIDNPGIELDCLYDIYKNGQYIGSFGFEDQIKEFSFQLKDNRSSFYICSMVFREGRKDGPLNKKNYENLMPAYILWIFPFTSRSRANSLRIFPIELVPKETDVINLDKENFNIGKVSENKPIICQSISAYLGNPNDLINLNQLEGKYQKYYFLLKVIDAIFKFDIGKNNRLEILKEFNLDNQSILEEVDTMTDLELFLEAAQGPLKEELEEKDNIIEEKDNQIKNITEVNKKQAKNLSEDKEKIKALEEQNRILLDRLKQYEPVPV